MNTTSKYENLSNSELENLIAEKTIKFREKDLDFKSSKSAHTYNIVESLDNEIHSIKVELLKRTNTEGEKLFFIVYGKGHVVPLITENGIVKKGGLLDNYFTGKSAKEHEAYVIGRHGKKLTEIIFVSKNITEDKIEIEVKLNDVSCKLSSNYKITVNQSDYFYIEFQNKEIKRLDSERGLSEKERWALTYCGAYLYQQTFAPNKHINMR